MSRPSPRCEHAAEHARQRVATKLLGAGSELSTPASAGARVSPMLAGPPDQVGQWGAPFPIPIFGIHAVMLPTGKVMWWSYPFGRGERAKHGGGLALGPGHRDLKSR